MNKNEQKKRKNAHEIAKRRTKNDTESVILSVVEGPADWPGRAGLRTVSKIYNPSSPIVWKM